MKRFHLVWVLLMCVFLVPAFAGDGEPEIDWLDGPATVTMGDDLARLDLQGQYVFADAQGAQELMKYMGNTPSGQELGVVFPRDSQKNWYILFEYDPAGYIKDDEKDDIDADAILESIREGTEAANEEREKQGFDPIHVVGWYEEPSYDAVSHNLTWAIQGRSSNGDVVNYNTRLLGRHGYTSVLLVTDPAELEADKEAVRNVIASFSYQQGKSYAEYVKGDKLAAYGLTALIAGGAGAAAAKFGLFSVLAKAWKAVAAGVIAAFAAVGSALKRLFGRKD